MKEFLLAKGVTVPNLTGIHECYEINQRNESFVFTVNVSADNIEQLLKNFCSELTEQCFFILEVPTNGKDEKLIRLKETDPFHCDVYYCDGLSKQTLLELFEKYGELLINDGMVCFGVASHDTHDELYIGRYKITSIFTADKQRYKNWLDKMGIPFEEDIKTVWNNFSRETPGRTSSISIGGKSIYDIAEELKEYGLYFAERREQ